MSLRLSEEELKRYSRHLLLPNFGVEGQGRLLRASALIVGLGQQGSAAALYLAAAGIGKLGLVEPESSEDADVVRYPSCRRDAALAGSVSRRLRGLNPGVRVEEYRTVDPELVGAYDLVVGCVRTVRMRRELNHLCLAQGRPLVAAAVWGWEGQAFTVLPGKGPCWRCAAPGDRDGSWESLTGMMGAVAGAMGILQATEVIKLLLGVGEPLARRTLFFDGLTGRFRQAECSRDPGCPFCSGTKGE